MSHFILQSVKVVKLTDGEKELYTLGFAGKDNNVSYYGANRTNVEFFQTVMPDKILSAISSCAIDVLCGGMQLKDKYNEDLSIQAEFFTKRLTTSFKNAKTVKVDKLTENGIEWGEGKYQLIQLFDKVYVTVSDTMTYKHSISEKEMNHGDFVKFMLDKEKTKEKVVSILKECKYAAAYLPIQENIVDRFGRIVQEAKEKDKLTLDEVKTVAKYSGDWNNPIKRTEVKMSDINEIVSILENDEDPARRFTVIIGFISPNVLENKEFAKRVGHLGISLTFFSDDIKADKEIAGIFCQAAGRNAEFVSNELKDDKEFILNLTKSSRESLRYASKRLCDDEEVVKAAIQKDPYAIQFVSERLRDDPEICLMCAEKYSFAHQYFSDRLKEICDKDNPIPGLRKIILDSEIQPQNNQPDKRMKI